jgi:hypothetical protein
MSSELIQIYLFSLARKWAWAPVCYPGTIPNEYFVKFDLGFESAWYILKPVKK